MTSRLMFFDGHNDSLEKVYQDQGDGVGNFLRGKATDHMDLPRIQHAGFAGGLFAIFVPNQAEDSYRNEGNVVQTAAGYEVRMAPPVPFDEATSYTADSIGLLDQLIAGSEGRMVFIKHHRELATTMREGKVAVVLHFEGAEAIAPDLHNLQAYYDQGLRSLGLVWSRPNAFGEGVPFRFPHSPDTGPGLSKAGKRLVRACNDMGIVVDLAHINAKGFWDVANLSSKPLVVTHSGVHGICPSTRNLTDDQMDAIGESRGIIGVYFDVTGVRRDGDRNPSTPLSAVVEHVCYIIDQIGIDHVGLGSDFDGAIMPQELSDIAQLPALANALQKAGLSPRDIQKVTHDNWVRVLRSTWVS